MNFLGALGINTTNTFYFPIPINLFLVEFSCMPLHDYLQKTLSKSVSCFRAEMSLPAVQKRLKLLWSVYASELTMPVPLIPHCCFGFLPSMLFAMDQFVMFVNENLELSLECYLCFYCSVLMLNGGVFCSR